jgi:hypothetical protein
MNTTIMIAPGHRGQRVLRVPIYFVLGNYDFYGSSMAVVREMVLGEMGHDSGADGRLGFFGSKVLLNDERRPPSVKLKEGPGVPGPYSAHDHIREVVACPLGCVSRCMLA